jgi:hypothetical protein
VVLQVEGSATSPRQVRRAEIDVMVKASFDASGGVYGSPRILDDLREAGERVPKKTVEALHGPSRPRRPTRPTSASLASRQAKGAEPCPDLIRRDFHADAIT